MDTSNVTQEERDHCVALLPYLPTCSDESLATLAAFAAKTYGEQSVLYTLASGALAQRHAQAQGATR